MSPAPDMKFRLRDLPESREFALAEEFVRDALAAIPGQSNVDEPPGDLQVTVEVTEEQPQTVFAHGRLAGRARVACSRCLGAVELAVSEEFSLVYLPHPDPEDDEVEVHDGKEVDISRGLRDHIVLSVPYAPLCSEQCKGLCAQCGADLNQGQCECAPVIDSRWAALENLKLK